MVSLGHSHRRHSAASNRSSVDESKVSDPEDETTVVEPDQGNVLSHIISQLRPGADLSRVVLPTFILEPRSMLERITKCVDSSDGMPRKRWKLNVLTCGTSRDIITYARRRRSSREICFGGQILPKWMAHQTSVSYFVDFKRHNLLMNCYRGVKKPLNPVLGEIYTCYWQFPDNTKGYYISEQTSHHPPKSSYFYMAPEHKIRIDGCLKPRSKFLGNSAASMMEGIAILRFLNRGTGPKGERYILTQPNMYARGILFGKMKYELGDHSFVRCPELGLSADIEFKTKGYFGGTYNAIGGTIKNDKTGEVLYELSGMWSGEMTIKNVKTGKKEVLFDATRARPSPPLSRPLEEQDDRESQKLWAKTAKAVKERNHELATDEKTFIEDMQRDEAARRVEDGVEWHPRLFRAVRGGPGGPEEGEEDLDWILNATIDGDTPEKQTEQILAVYPILPGQKFSEKNQIPPQYHQPEQAKAPEQVPAPTPVSASAPAPAPAPPAPAAVPVPAAPLQAQENLIDFNADSPTVSHTANSHSAQTENNQQKDLENTLQSTSTSQAQHGLIDFHDDLRKDLPTGEENSATLKRQDTDTQSLDEFVDAES
ncbi:oxysterol-binding protein [Rutstroemia sp. NJR-2017a BVV2]|nr:oxysterol-binding protein [Rutstroemia sp. NJR-2017a BVV2]